MIKALETGVVNSAGIMVPCPPQRTYDLGGQAEWEGRRCNPGGSHAVPPRLFRACLEISAPVCGPPAIDREFKTIDFLTLVDLQALPDRVGTRFF